MQEKGCPNPNAYRGYLTLRGQAINDHTNSKWKQVDSNLKSFSVSIWVILFATSLLSPVHIGYYKLQISCNMTTCANRLASVLTVQYRIIKGHHWTMQDVQTHTTLFNHYQKKKSYFLFVSGLLLSVWIGICPYFGWSGHNSLIIAPIFPNEAVTWYML